MGRWWAPESTASWETKLHKAQEHQAKGSGGIFQENKTLVSPICEVNKTLAQERSNVPNQTKPKGGSEILPARFLQSPKRSGVDSWTSSFLQLHSVPPPDETAAPGRA